MKLELNNELQTYEERSNFVLQLIESGMEFDKNQLDRLTTYLLQKAPKKEGHPFTNKVKQELDLSYKNGKKNCGVDLELVNDSMKMKNIYINMDFKVTSQDLKADNYKGKVLREYQQLKDHFLQQKNDGTITLWQYKQLAIGIAEDMLEVKRANDFETKKDTQACYLGETIDWGWIDYSEAKHIEAILRNISLDADVNYNDSLTLIALDMIVAMEKLGQLGILSREEVELVYKINRGYTLQELEIEYGIQFSGIRKRYLKICDKIAKFYASKVEKIYRNVIKIGQKKAS